MREEVPTDRVDYLAAKKVVPLTLYRASHSDPVSSAFVPQPGFSHIYDPEIRKI